MSIKLSNRLSAIASFVSPGSRVIDVGTDHGHIPVFLIQNRICEYATASDINEGPLMSARKTSETNFVADKIKFVLTDGLTGISNDDGDTVIIAGMGGETIVKILSAASWIKDKNVHLILQPQSKIKELISWLGENSISIENARLAKDDGKIYLILSARFSKVSAENNVFELLKDSGDELFTDYLDSIIEKNEKAIAGMKRSEHKKSDEERLTAETNAIRKLKEDILNGNSKRCIQFS